MDSIFECFKTKWEAPNKINDYCYYYVTDHKPKNYLTEKPSYG